MMIGQGPADGIRWSDEPVAGAFRADPAIVAPCPARAGRERDLLVQSMKAAVAAVLAWVIADEWLGAPMSFLAP
ncbi:hypothetical protein ACGFNU_14120 [Spirillospora sp. NPDC048911]|uniref:hypothetical protein n=1 Tax=Spirillospora sp. NPDC048911 TaxID=3364527 RepID=UPI003710DF0F